MKKKWISYTAALALCAGLLMPAGQLKAAAASVKVTLPKFEVKLNGHTVDNQYREYPLLVYRDITYMPMTWSDTRLLGLETTWSKAAGLSIMQRQVAASYEPYKSGSRNASAYSAKLAASPITVNGKAINNAKEPYPLLSFRNVTYFPLTWRFAHDEFGWEYKWNAASGLSITSHNPQLVSAGLPGYAGDNDVALFGGYYYFVQTTGTTNHIYRAPAKQPFAKELIYSYSFEGSDPVWNPAKVTFQIRGNALWFTYHLGGGFSGTNEFVKISGSGKAELMHNGYLDFRDTPYGTLFVNLALGGDGNLYFKEGDTRKVAGDPDLMFAYHAAQNGRTATTVIGDDAYVLCQLDAADPYYIYRINLKTNITEKIVEAPVSWFRIADNKLYYINKAESSALFSSELDGTNEKKLSEHAVSWFDSVDGNLFYTTKINSTQSKLYKVNTNGEDQLVWTSPVASVQALNHRLVFRPSGGDGVVLLNGTGRLLLKIEDPVARVITSDNDLLIQHGKHSSIAVVR